MTQLKDDRKNLESLFPTVVQDLTALPEFQDIPETNQWLSKVLTYNVPHGKKNRGLDMVSTYRHFAKNPTAEDIHLSYILGWCVELFQSFLLVCDDIMDQSKTRRGQPCWYQLEDVGMTGFNDGILIECSVYSLLKKYFRTKDYYVNLLEEFQHTTFQTTIGECLDLRTSNKHFETYTLERYSSVAKYKTAYYTYNFPIALAMTIAEINNPQLRKEVQIFSLQIGDYIQIKDDFLDCFGDEKITGRVGTDMTEGKCAWPFVMALQNANIEQRKTLLTNYGSNNLTKIQNVKRVYADLKIAELFYAFEEETHKKILTCIEQMSSILPKKLFRDMVEKVYHRTH